MEISANPTPSSGISTVGHGASHVPLYMVREVKIYPVQENELTTLSLLSHQFTGALSIAGGVVGFLLSILWDMATSPEPAKRTLGLPLTVFCLATIAACFVIALLTRRKRKTELGKILDESRLIGKLSGPST